MKTFTIKVKFKTDRFDEVQRTFIRGRVNGIIHAIAGEEAFVAAIAASNDDLRSTFAFEATDEQYQTICNILDSMYLVDMEFIEFEF